MTQFFQYYGKYQAARGRWGGLPSWARLVLLVAALPGLILASLSILALLVSILALLVLTVPTFRLLQALTGTTGEPGPTPVVNPLAEMFSPPASANRRHVDVKIVE